MLKPPLGHLALLTPAWQDNATIELLLLLLLTVAAIIILLYIILPALTLRTALSVGEHQATHCSQAATTMVMPGILAGLPAAKRTGWTLYRSCPQTLSPTAQSS